MVELALILTVLLMFTAGLLDVGRGMYQYTLTQAAAQYGARWASVVGGQCSSTTGASVSDWCNQDATSSGSFWSQPGNAPLQSGGTACPTTYVSGFSGYYTVSDYASSSATNIVGAIAQHFDTNSTSSGLIDGGLVPGLDPSLLKVCIQLTWDAVQARWAEQSGDSVQIWVYYPFAPVTPLITELHSVSLVASSDYRID